MSSPEHRVSTLISRSALAAAVTALSGRLELAWHASTARRAARAVAATLGDRRAGAATLGIAAAVALVLQQLAHRPEPAVWLLPACVLVWSIATLALNAASSDQSK